MMTPRPSGPLPRIWKTPLKPPPFIAFPFCTCFGVPPANPFYTLSVLRCLTISGPPIPLSFPALLWMVYCCKIKISVYIYRCIYLYTFASGSSSSFSSTYQPSIIHLSIWKDTIVDVDCFRLSRGIPSVFSWKPYPPRSPLGSYFFPYSVLWFGKTLLLPLPPGLEHGSQANHSTNFSQSQ